ncbi:viral A-type inclusion protein [Reticulomyxa filosa]|uniref:Viral A-type inclusion protein n=1 Tax=Reticulomyxa filosa TaxID=46433 RepID=X6MZH4_RETFI|nr:viral A-type inclusion protein [Reticulomyxa filosa]|eukprot:ETO19420.1 viral A-type inclusion protein [Reticulomyxa filosa]
MSNNEKTKSNIDVHSKQNTELLKLLETKDLQIDQLRKGLAQLKSNKQDSVSIYKIHCSKLSFSNKNQLFLFQREELRNELSITLRSQENNKISENEEKKEKEQENEKMKMAQAKKEEEEEEAVKKELDILKAKYRALEQEKTQWTTSETNRMQNEEKKWKQANHGLQKQKDDLKQELDKVTQQKNQLMQEKNQLAQEKNQLTQEKDQLVKENKKLEREKQNLERQNNALTQSNEKLVQENTQLSQNNHDIKNEDNNKNDDMNQKQLQEIQRLRQENKSLVEEHKRLNTLLAATPDHSKLVQENQRLCEEHRQLVHENNSYKSLYSITRTLKQKNDSLIRQVLDLKQENERLTLFQSTHTLSSNPLSVINSPTFNVPASSSSSLDASSPSVDTDVTDSQLLVTTSVVTPGNDPLPVAAKAKLDDNDALSTDAQPNGHDNDNINPLVLSAHVRQEERSSPAKQPIAADAVADCKWINLLDTRNINKHTYNKSQDSIIQLEFDKWNTIFTKEARRCPLFVWCHPSSKNPQIQILYKPSLSTQVHTLDVGAKFTYQNEKDTFEVTKLTPTTATETNLRTNQTSSIFSKQKGITNTPPLPTWWSYDSVDTSDHSVPWRDVTDVKTERLSDALEQVKTHIRDSHIQTAWQIQNMELWAAYCSNKLSWTHHQLRSVITFVFVYTAILQQRKKQMKSIFGSGQTAINGRTFVPNYFFIFNTILFFVVKSITIKGFQIDQYNEGMHGLYFYQTPDQALQHKGSATSGKFRHLIYAIVLCGESDIAPSSTQQRPNKPNTSIPFETLVDDLKNPTFYVVGFQNQAYPIFSFQFQ